ncbi:MAG: R3H domain-containing nucleic acid-binding protein [archaeon]|nr:R3H domain-containing nucleic acid-binding protein [archaeon]
MSHSATHLHLQTPLPNSDDTDLSFDLVFGEDSMFARPRSLSSPRGPQARSSPRHIPAEAKHRAASSTNGRSPPPSSSCSSSYGASSPSSDPEVRARNREREIERDRNSLLIRSVSGDHFNITTLIRFIEKSLPLTIKTYHYRDKQSFCFMQFHTDADTNSVVHLLNSKVLEGTGSFIAQRVARVTPGRDPNDTEHSPEATSATLVIKNLPFALKHDQLKAVLSSYDTKPENVAFHYDASGMFRGMAFVKYATSEEASEIYEKINGMDVGGRSIRVEYKKNATDKKLEFDPTDEEMKRTYEQLFHFKTQSKLPILSFPSTLSSYQRRQIHIVADKLDLDHYSEGDGENRYLIIAKREPTEPVRTSPSYESFVLSQTSTSPLPHSFLAPSSWNSHAGESSSWRERERRAVNSFGVSPQLPSTGSRRSSVSSVTSPTKSPRSAAAPGLPLASSSPAHRSRSVSTNFSGPVERVSQSRSTCTSFSRDPQFPYEKVCLPIRQPTGPNPNNSKGFSEHYQKQRMAQICQAAFETPPALLAASGSR